MERSEVEALCDRAQLRYFRAYDQFDRTLKKLGMSDDQVLKVVAAVQPMLTSKEDRVLLATYRDYLEAISGEARVDFATEMNACAESIKAEYDRDEAQSDAE